MRPSVRPPCTLHAPFMSVPMPPPPQATRCTRWWTAQPPRPRSCRLPTHAARSLRGGCGMPAQQTYRVRGGSSCAREWEAGMRRIAREAWAGLGGRHEKRPPVWGGRLCRPPSAPRHLCGPRPGLAAGGVLALMAAYVSHAPFNKMARRGLSRLALQDILRWQWEGPACCAPCRALAGAAHPCPPWAPQGGIAVACCAPARLVAALAHHQVVCPVVCAGAGRGKPAAAQLAAAQLAAAQQAAAQLPQRRSHRHQQRAAMQQTRGQPAARVRPCSSRGRAADQGSSPLSPRGLTHGRLPGTFPPRPWPSTLMPCQWPAPPTLTWTEPSWPHPAPWTII